MVPWEKLTWDRAMQRLPGGQPVGAALRQDRYRGGPLEHRHRKHLRRAEVKADHAKTKTWAPSLRCLASKAIGTKADSWRQPGSIERGRSGGSGELPAAAPLPARMPAGGAAVSLAAIAIAIAIAVAVAAAVWPRAGSPAARTVPRGLSGVASQKRPAT
jgi:hypothetical protein